MTTLPAFPETPTPARFPMYAAYRADTRKEAYIIRCDVREKTAGGTAKVVESRPLPDEPMHTLKQVEERLYSLNLAVWQMIKGA